MNGKRSKLIRKRARELQLEWINSLLTEDSEQVTAQTLEQVLPEQEYYYKGFTMYLSFMNHKWIEKKLKKNINLKLNHLK